MTEIDRRLDLQARGVMNPFTIIDTASGEPVGMTTFMDIDQSNKRLEIGNTWLRQSVQRGGLNTEAKLMLLTHAFETLACNAVELRTHAMNLQSRRAIERLGAKLDGILRHHRIIANGTLRDTCVYSIIAPEWPAVRANLEWRLEAGSAPKAG
jgi:N-acetyltransferase